MPRVAHFISLGGRQRAKILGNLARSQLYAAVQEALDSGKLGIKAGSEMWDIHGSHSNPMKQLLDDLWLLLFRFLGSFHGMWLHVLLLRPSLAQS